MSTGEDEPSPNLNGRLRPRRSTNSATPIPQTKTIRKPDGKPAPDRPKRTSAPSKASPAKQDDLVIKFDAVPAPSFLCSYCDKKFNSRQTVSKHARRIHLSISKQDNFIKCLYCNHSDAESNAIIKHMVDSHPNQYFACLECHTRFPSTSELAEHKLNVCEKQKQPYRSKLRQKSLSGIKRKPKKSIKNEKTENSNESTRLTDDLSFNGIVISCELKPSDTHDGADIEDKITTNLILPSSKALGNTTVEKNAVIVLDDFQWNKRIPPNFSFHNSDADQILSRLGVVHRSPRVGESRKDLVRLMDEPNEKFEKCFDTSFYSKVARNVQENLAKYLDGTFNFNPNKDITIRTRKSKASATINTAEGFPILLSHEQFSRNMYDGFIPRAVAPKHKWKWDSAENERNLVMLLDQTKRDSHVNSCIITLISSLDIWTQLRMKNKFEEIFKTAPHAKKTEKQNIISLELKEILESRDIPSRSSGVVQYKRKPAQDGAGPELPAYLGLSASGGECELQPAVLSGEWVRPRCFVCCACGDQTRDARTLSAHLATRHPNAQVQHYEIVGETLLSADILKHLYVPPSQMSNRTRPPRGFRDCTKCKKSVTLEDLHQHMLDCAGDTPTVRRKCRYRPFGVRRRRQRLPDNTIRKKIRKDMRSRHRQKAHIRPRPRIRTEVGDAESIRKMIADLPAKRNRITPTNILRPRRTVLKTKKQVKLRSNEDKKSKLKSVQNFNKTKKAEILKKQNDTENSSTVDEDDQPLKLSSTRVFTRRGNSKEVLRRRATINKTKKKMQSPKQNRNLRRCAQKCYSQYNNTPPDELNSAPTYHPIMQQSDLGFNPVTADMTMTPNEIIRPMACHPNVHPFHRYYYSNQHLIDQERLKNASLKQTHRGRRNTVQEDRMVHYYQPGVQDAYQRIDLRSAGPSNFRRHSNCDDHNLQNRQDWPIEGGRSRNQNSNVAQTPNTPLKHSIASITTDTDGHNAALPYHNPYSMQLEMSTRVHEPADSRNIFENEVTIDKVDKPPLPTFADLSKAANDQGLLSRIPTGMSHASAYMPTSCNLNMPQIPIEAQFLSNEPLGSRTSDRMFLHQASMELNNFIRQRPLSDNMEESPRFVEQPLKQIGLPLSTGRDRENNKTRSNIEAEKVKSNKIRKRLNDCIAMLQTKKGFCLNQDQGKDKDKVKDKDSKSIASETIDLETVDSDLSLTASKITEEIDHNEKNKDTLTSSYSIQGQVASGSLPNDESVAQIGNAYSPMKIPLGGIILTRNRDENESYLTKSLQLARSAVPSELTITDPQGKLVPEETHRILRKGGNSTSMNLRMHDMALTVDKTHKMIQGKQQDVNLNLQQNDSKNILYDMYRKTINAPESIRLASEGIVVTPPQENAVDSEDVNDLTRPSRQVSVSPTSRRTRRKPIKKKSDLVDQINLVNEEGGSSIPVESLQNQNSHEIGECSIDSNKLRNPSFVSEVSPSHEILHLKTPPSPAISLNTLRVRHESYRRVSETNVENVSLTQHIRSPAEISAENVIKRNNLRRQSYELANQIATSNYVNMMNQSYRDQYEKSIMNISQTSKGMHRPHMANPDDCNKNDYEKAKEIPSRLSLKSTYVSKTHDTHGIMHVNPNCNTESSAPREIHDHLRSYENEQFMAIQTQRFENVEYPPLSLNVRNQVDQYSNQEIKGMNKTSAVLDNRQTPELYYTRSSPFSSKICNPNIINHSLDSPFAVPSMHSNNLLHIPSLSRDSDVGVPLDAPLDLTCDTKSRDQKSSLGPGKSVLERSTDICTTSMNINKTPDNGNTYSNFHQDYTADSLNRSQNSRMPPKNDRIEVPVIQPKSGECITQEQSSSQLTYQPALNAVVIESEISECLDGSTNTSDKPNIDCETTQSNINVNINNFLNEQSQPLSRGSNFTTMHDTPILNIVPIYAQENELDNMALENKNSTQDTLQLITEPKLQEHEIIINIGPFAPTNTISRDVDKINQRESYHHIGSHVISPDPRPIDEIQDMNNQNKSNLDVNSKECNAQTNNREILSENDSSQTEHDEETARKIALLPEELVKILGTIPKDHRNQLLNILPQYVATPILKVENDTRNKSSLSDSSKQNVSTDNNPNRLSVNTTISPSSVIPKKRHSPSHPTGRFNSTESLATGTMPPLLVSRLSQYSPQVDKDSTNNCKDSLADNLTETSSENINLEQINTSSGNDSNNVVVDLPELSYLDKSNDVQLRATYLCPNTSQESILKPPFKQKPPNEQTASLRAVRIKTTSSKKSFGEERKILSNVFTYSQNVAMEEKCSNSTQFTSPATVTSQNCSVNPNELQYETAQISNHQQENNAENNVTNQLNINQNKDQCHDVIKVTEPVIISETKVKNDDILTRDVDERQNESTTSCDSLKDEQSETTISPQKSPSRTPQVSGINAGSFLEQLNSTSTFSMSKDKISVQDLDALPSRNDEPASKSVELNSKNNDCTPNFKCITSDETIENKPIEKFDDNKLCTLETERNEVSKDELTNEFRTESIEPDLKSNYERSSKQEEPIEDDSEDDETLAAIKEKHHKTNSKTCNFTISMGVVAYKSKSTNKNIKKKILPKRQRKKLPKTSKLSRKKKISRDVECLKHTVIRDPYTETKCTNAAESNDDLNEVLLDVSPITAVIDKVNEFGVNKENHVTDNMNSKIMENINCVTDVESNEYEISHHSGDKNQEKNVLEYTAELLEEEAQESTDLKALSQMEHGNSLPSFEDNQSSLNQTIDSSKIENTCCLPEVDKKNELDLSCSILDEAKEYKNKIIKVSVKESNALNPSEFSKNNIASDPQLCSEDSEVNTMHLRRSKRGKSMYVDSSYKEDGEKTEDRVNKTPLTMKRLILSRVEKDRKRISESDVPEKDCKTVIDHVAAAYEEPEITRRKGKLPKRKKSPHPRRTSKKIKTINKCDHDDDFSDNSNVISTSDSNSCILRELPNAENKINEKDCCIDELKCRGISANTSNLSDNTILVTNDKDTDMIDDNSSDSRETVSKRKINSNKPSEIVLSKSKKTKCLENKSQSDFDSDDDKVLWETKQKIETKKYLDDHDLSNTSKELDNNEGSVKSYYKTTDDTRKQAISVSVPSESRIACYNRSISVKEPVSSPTSVKERAVYDPYDFDFIDTIESTEPVTKKKSKNTFHSSKSSQVSKKIVQREDIKKSTLKDSKLSMAQIKLNNESDSDSSKSDVPLQKYVDERTSNVDKKNKDKKSSMESYDNREEKDAFDLFPKCIDTVNNEPSLMKDEKETECNNDDKNIIDVSNTEICSVPFELTKPTMQTIEENNSADDGSSKEDSLNIISNKPVDETSQKQSNKQKKTRRTQVVHNVNTVAVSSEEDQQRRSDKFMENFGFFSERIPRKSNLLASKKITETMHMISNESDDSFLCYKEKSPKKSTSNENKKKSDPGNNLTETKDKKTITSEENKSEVKSVEPTIDPNEMVDASKKDDSDLDSLAAQAIMESEEVKTLENDLFSSLRAAAAEVKAGRNRFVGFGATGDLEATVKDCDPNVSLSQIEDKPVKNTEAKKKPSKTKQNKQVGVKDKMYPDIEEVDLFEDKFDIIKRKRRSQAVAAKQTQVVAETNTSAKSRKQSERKKSSKNTKKNYRSTHVPTKAALKGFESIKISIPTHDLNMPINISPPRQSKKRRKNSSRRRKEISDYESSSSDFGDRDKLSFERDIYEFKDSEDAELFELRPSTVMDRFRSMHNKHKLKHKEKDKIKHTDKEKNKNKEREKRLDLKDPSICETTKEYDKLTTTKEKEQAHKKYLSKDEGNSHEDIRKDVNYDVKNVEKDVHPVLKTQKGLDTPCLNVVSNNKNIIDSAVASTSGFAQNRIDESDYESGMSSPEGDFIFYMSNDVNCVCPSDNDSEDSDTERGCGRLNCVNKTRNADKNAAIENIFKNNAVRREKPEIKEPEKPRPNLDQLFDSLLETESKSNNDISENKKEATISNTELNKTELKKNYKKSVSPISKQNLSKDREENELSLNTNNVVSMYDESYNNTHPPTNNKKDDHGLDRLDPSSSLCQNEILTEPCEMEIFSINEKPKENLGYSLMSEESTQVTFSDILAHNATITDEPNDGKVIETKSTKANATKKLTNYNSEDEFDIDKPETLNRQYMHLILPAEKATSAVQTDEKIGNSDEEPDSCYESAASKYLKELSSSEAANTEMYNTESAQSTQTGKPNRLDSEPSKHVNYTYLKTENDLSVVSRSRIPLQKYDVRDIATKSNSTKSIEIEKNKNYQHDIQVVSADDSDRNEKLTRTDEPNAVKGSIKKVTKTAEDVDAFTAPASVSTTEKHSPRKSDEGISTSHDYSADAFDQSFDYAGVACQRARRKCTVGKQNVLAEHWSSESEFDGAPARPNSADSVVASAPRKKKSKKKEHHSSGKKSRHLSKGESKSGRRRAVSGGQSEDSDAGGGGGPSGVGGVSGPRAPVGPKIRARATHHYSSSEGEETAGPQPQHGWIVGDSHKKLVTMLAHAKGRKRNNADRHLD